MSHVARVGVILVVGVALLAGIFYLLTGRYSQMKSYPITVVFDNALGLQPGAKVRMAGVDVGAIDQITLTPDNRARLRLSISKEIGIPEKSRFTIATGALIGEKFIEIQPGNSAAVLEPEALIEGPEQVKKPFQIEEVGGEVTQLVSDFREVSRNLNTILGDAQLQRDLAVTVANMAQATARAEELMISVQGLVARNQAQVDTTMTNLAQASQELRAVMTDVRAMVRQPELRNDVVETASTLRTASERLDAVLQDVRDVTGDPEVSRNLKQTAENLSEASGYARDVGERVNRLFSGGPPKVTINVPKPQFQSGTRMTLESAGSGSGNVRTDLVFTIPTNKNEGLRLGLYDFTENSRAIAQRIQWMDPRTAMRYGIYAGRVGVGMDYDAGSRWRFTGDLYDPKFPRMDLRGRYYYSKNFGLVFGVDGILRQPTAVVGIQWRQ